MGSSLRLPACHRVSLPGDSEPGYWNFTVFFRPCSSTIFGEEFNRSVDIWPSCASQDNPEHPSHSRGPKANTPSAGLCLKLLLPWPSLCPDLLSPLPSKFLLENFLNKPQAHEPLSQDLFWRPSHRHSQANRQLSPTVEKRSLPGAETTVREPQNCQRTLPFLRTSLGCSGLPQPLCSSCPTPFLCESPSFTVWLLPKLPPPGPPSPGICRLYVWVGLDWQNPISVSPSPVAWWLVQKAHLEVI